MSSFSHQSLLFVLLCLLASHQCAEARYLKTSKELFRCVYTFGDSYVDPGNNDFINTPFRSNFPPYGRDFPGKVATGRFSNGLLFPDILAHYNALQLFKQIDIFKEYKLRLENAIGKKKADSQIEQAIFYVNAGSDNFAFTYFHDGIGQPNKNPRDYERFLLSFIRRFFKDLLEQGAQKIAVNGLPPLGCIPVGITLLPQPAKNIEDKARTCIGYVNAISQDFNSMLQEELEDLQSQHLKTKIVYIDFVEPLLDVIQNPHEYGYTEVNKGCCGTGLSEIGTQCNATTSLCSDSDKYVFWDAAHPTEKTYHLIFRSNLAAIDDLIGS
ncbi:hypothetical protein RHMOL_Rhmol06G0253600 [Rhododendron molle]|uniref:Uncharacterized protein n=1 Tax=Rhododendron molle TaxID=49168 RepID=A0ACC0NG84_RHOML|nr:hypothetical protein RHMOL_Rhmol06G0253600 [Rhododendron molle]